MNDLIFKLKKTYLCIENKKIIIAILLIFNLTISFYKYDITDLNMFQFILYHYFGNIVLYHTVFIYIYLF